MRLWTIHSIEVYQVIQRTGVYRCDPALISMLASTLQYDWLAEQMTKRIGPPPDGVKYPVWAWYKWYGKSVRPDLRRMRWEIGIGGERLACIEVEIPDEQVLLSDEDTWHFVLNGSWISKSEEEYDEISAYLQNLSPQEEQDFKRKNWERVFDVLPSSGNWISDGDFIQACFWELKKEQIRDVRYFTAQRRMRD